MFDGLSGSRPENLVNVKRFCACAKTRIPVNTVLRLRIDPYSCEYAAPAQQFPRQSVAQLQVLQSQERRIFQQTRVEFGVDAVPRDVGHVARLLPAVEQTARLVVRGEAAVRFVEVAVVVYHPAVGHPAELGRQREPFPREGRAESAFPRRIHALADHHLVFVAQFGRQFAVLGVPQGIAVCRVHPREAVDEVFAYVVAHHQFLARVGQFIFLYAVVEFRDLVLRVGERRVERPREVACRHGRSRQRKFHTAVHHAAYVVPAESVSVVRVRLGYFHQHVYGLLVVELQVYVQPVPEPEVQAEVGRPRFLPLQSVGALLYGYHARVARIVGSAADERQMFVVGYRAVARGSRRDLYLRVGQPAAHPFHEAFVAHVP